MLCMPYHLRLVTYHIFYVHCVLRIDVRTYVELGVIMGCAHAGFDPLSELPNVCVPGW